MKKQQRAYKAGVKMAESIIEMVHLMYQNNTAAHFYKGLRNRIIKEMVERDIIPPSTDLAFLMEVVK